MSIDDYKFIDKTGGNITDTDLAVVYIKFLGTDINNANIYQFYLSNTPEIVYAEGWGDIPACNVPSQLMDIDEGKYSYVLECRTQVKLELAQDCCCFSMQDARDHIIALAYENIIDLEEYPEPRIIIQFGDLIADVEQMFAKRDIVLRYV